MLLQDMVKFILSYIEFFLFTPIHVVLYILNLNLFFLQR
jgi:hypothetical protein